MTFGESRDTLYNFFQDGCKSKACADDRKKLEKQLAKANLELAKTKSDLVDSKERKCHYKELYEALLGEVKQRKQQAEHKPTLKTICASGGRVSAAKMRPSSAQSVRLKSIKSVYSFPERQRRNAV